MKKARDATPKPSYAKNPRYDNIPHIEFPDVEKVNEICAACDKWEINR